MGRFSGGWIKAHRSLFNGDYDGYDIVILLWLVANANYADGKSLARSGHQRTIIRRGQILTSVREMAEALSLANGLIRNRLNNFVKEQILANETTNTGSLITICNYDKYQCIETVEEQTVEQPENKRRTNGEQTESNILKNIRNKEGKNIQDNCTENEQKDKYTEMADAIVAVWNQALTDVLPKVTKLTDKRRKHINAQLKKYPDMEHWQTCFEKVKASDFLTGRSGQWKCNFDWVLNENNRTKVLEGNYDNKEQQKNYKTDSRVDRSL